MLKALGIFIRLVCSLAILFAVALYLPMTAQPLSTAVPPEQFVDGITLDAVKGFFTSLNWVSITAGALVLCALLRLLDMAWNIAFCLSSVAVLFCGLWTVWGPAVALPAPLQGNEYMTQLCTLPLDYPVPALIVMAVFAMGWLAATAPFRIAFTTAVSFGLWYGITCLMHWAIVTRWADTPTPAQPEVLAMVLANPWIIAALPGVFFLVYAVLVAFFETFLSAARKKAPKAEQKPAEQQAEEKKPEPAPLAKPVSKVLKPMAKPAVNPTPKPTAKPAAKPATAAAPLPAVPKAEPKPAPNASAEPASPAPKPEAKAEVKPTVEPAPKPEEKPVSPAPEAKKEETPEVKPETKTEAKPAPKAEEAPKPPTAA